MAQDTEKALPVIPCAGEYMGLAAFMITEDDGSKSLNIAQAPVVAWQVDPEGWAHPVTLTFHAGYKDVSGQEVYRATDVLDVKSGKVYEVGDNGTFENLAEYKAYKLECYEKRLAKAKTAKPQSAA